MDNHEYYICSMVKKTQKHYFHVHFKNHRIMNLEGAYKSNPLLIAGLFHLTALDVFDILLVYPFLDWCLVDPFKMDCIFGISLRWFSFESF